MEEIIHTVDQLRMTVREFESLIHSDQKADLTSLRQELETSLEVAKRTEQRCVKLMPRARPIRTYIQTNPTREIARVKWINGESEQNGL